MGTAVLNTIAVTATTAYVSSHHLTAATPDALVHGYAAATGWTAGLLVVVALVAGVLIHSGTMRSNASTSGIPEESALVGKEGCR